MEVPLRSLAGVLILLGSLVLPLRASWMDSSMGLLQGELTARYGPDQRLRIQRGLAQAARFWRPGDGGAGEFEGFVRAQFAGRPADLDRLFERLEQVMASLEGRLLGIGRGLREPAEDPPLPVDALLATLEPGIHLPEDAFRDKLAFAVLLNFPLTTVQERVRDGGSWTRRQWAEAWLTERFARRAPAQADQAGAEAAAAAERTIAGLTIRADHLLDARGRHPFPPGLRLLAHWDLRDEIRAQYREGPAGLARQRELQKVLERLVTQTIPAVVIDNPGVDWDPASNALQPAGQDAAPDETRYRMLLRTFQAARELDPYCPLAPTRMARVDQERQLSEARVRALLEAVCGSPLAARTARCIRGRLGRALEPFDIWYAFPGEAGRLDDQVRRRYPTANAYAQDLPNLLRALGFTPEKAAWLAGRIQVAPARGSGYALGARPWADLRVRVPIGPGGMDARGFHIAVHETGHAAALCFARDQAEPPLAAGAPRAAFAEALAWMFQARDLELLGQPRPAAATVLEAFWSTWEMAGSALVDLDVWHWLYQHPGASAAELEAAVAAAAGALWNRYYAPLLGQKDCVLLACRSHLVTDGLGLPDYPLSRMIAFQIRRGLGPDGRLGDAFERCARLGRLTPDLWMTRATGSPLGPEALLEATEAALQAVR
jgi:hypothetical protein